MPGKVEVSSEESPTLLRGKSYPSTRCIIMQITSEYVEIRESCLGEFRSLGV
jgi:hypothetical protein